jgi:hypothetical protein
MLLFGGRKKLSIQAIVNQPSDINTKYVAGSGVGANSIAVRRAKLLRASTTCCRYADSVGSTLSSSIASSIPLPNSPTNFIGIAGNQQVTLSWTASSPAILHYIISYNELSFITTSTSIIITGLTNDISYIFSIVAVNIAGSSSKNYTPSLTPIGPYGSILFAELSSNLSYSGVTIGTQPFTIDGWFYITSTSVVRRTIIGARYGTTGGLSLFIYDTNGIRIDQLGVTAFTFDFPTITPNIWHYFAIVRNSSNQEMAFIDTTPSTTAVRTDTINYATSPLIGAWDSDGAGSADSFQDYLSNIRIIVGTNLYSPTATSIVIPTPHITAITNTQLLLNTTYDSNYIKDSSSNNYTMTNTSVVSSSLAPF